MNWIKSQSNRTTKSVTQSPLLPKGEGRDEGEGSVIGSSGEESAWMPSLVP